MACAQHDYSDPQRLHSCVAWADEDDESIGVDLASVHRLRKLRKEAHAANALVSGSEYEQLLQERCVVLS
jgi:hypothetical protein